MARSEAWVMVALLAALVASACSGPADSGYDADTKNEPPPFNPTIAVVVELEGNSDGEELIERFQQALEQLIGQVPRVELVEDPAEARLLFRVTYFIKKGSVDAGLGHRLQIIDNEHDVVIYEDARQLTTGFDREDEDVERLVNVYYEDFMERLEKPYSVASQVELGEADVAYLETSPWKDEWITYGRFDLGMPGRRVYLDYSIREMGHGFAGDAIRITANGIYKIVQRQKLEVATSAEAADFVIAISGGAGDFRSYTRVRDGHAAPVVTDSGATLSATIVATTADDRAEPLEVSVQGKPLPRGDLTGDPQAMSIDRFKSALGSELEKVRKFLTAEVGK
ncbi:MAG: hypothetical protein DWQ42_02600 [Planctomycetota bacterium]|nr:MAG: hypothetical protein DWQ42_02600 [Planctomycetota bacterium]REK43469.1 MAG: hypothetical protein DWQ46_11200 [Planctomycetota bacterium]